MFVTATDTGVGKTILSAALCAAVAAAGEAVLAHKPVVTGLDEHATPDHELLGAITGMAPERVSPLRFGPAVSPVLAGELAGAPIDAQQLLDAASSARAAAHEASAALIVEGVGGLLTPLAERFSVRDYAVELGLPIVVAARAGLGTINHTLLTLHAARASGLEVRAVVLTPWPHAPGALERSNRDEIAALGDVEVATLSRVAGADRAALAEAGESLPWRSWLAG